MGKGKRRVGIKGRGGEEKRERNKRKKGDLNSASSLY